jgi:hypothetical protein
MTNGETKKDAPRGLRRFFNAIPSLNPAEVLSEMLQEYALLRRLFFALLLLAALIWGSWNATFFMAGLWAFYEGMAYLTRLWRARGR